MEVGSQQAELADIMEMLVFYGNWIRITISGEAAAYKKTRLAASAYSQKLCDKKATNVMTNHRFLRRRKSV
jgi:hypothetical protein